MTLSTLCLCVTADELTALGFTVEKSDKVVGTKVVVVAGATFTAARAAAVAAGVVKLCGHALTRPNHVAEPLPVFDHEMLALLTAAPAA